jgi:hypothetical protein
MPRQNIVGIDQLLAYLDIYYPNGIRNRDDEWAVRSTFLRALALSKWWAGQRAALEGNKQQKGSDASDESTTSLDESVLDMVRKQLDLWETDAEKNAPRPPAVKTADADADAPPKTFFSIVGGGRVPSIGDYLLWAVLHHVVRVCGDSVLGPALGRYYEAYSCRVAAMPALEVAARR